MRTTITQTEAEVNILFQKCAKILLVIYKKVKIMTIVRHGTMQVVRAYQFKKGTVDSSTPKKLTDLGFTEDEVKQADQAMISVEDANIRYRIDGLGSPTTTIGHPVLANDDVSLYGFANLTALEFVSTSGTATLTITLAKRA